MKTDQVLSLQSICILRLSRAVDAIPVDFKDVNWYPLVFDVYRCRRSLGTQFSVQCINNFCRHHSDYLHYSHLIVQSPFTLSLAKDALFWGMLMYLDLSGLNVKNKTTLIQFISHLPLLSVLNLSRTGMDDTAIAVLVRGVVDSQAKKRTDKLTHLILSRNAHLTDKSTKYLSLLPSLRYIDLTGCIGFSDVGMLIMTRRFEWVDISTLDNQAVSNVISPLDITSYASKETLLPFESFNDIHFTLHYETGYMNVLSETPKFDYEDYDHLPTVHEKKAPCKDEDRKRVLVRASTNFSVASKRPKSHSQADRTACTLKRKKKATAPLEMDFQL